ncbi:MAG TPA: NYN domain-containing protein [Vicinamibacteria bacterium]|nr:NYN domain-containing protein [Vicinamibacteria bacterium]
MPYLIDGNNLLGSWGGPAIRGDGRAEVVRRVAEFCRARGARAILVFDGAPFRPELGDQDLGRLKIRFPAEGKDADSVIRETVDEAERPGEIVVVTSDRALYSYAKTRGASVLRAHEWNALASGAGPALRGRRAAATAGEKPERETDVEGWLERFSDRPPRR